ncbi:unnamed protein product [Ixodes hexagonus]
MPRLVKILRNKCWSNDPPTVDNCWHVVLITFLTAFISSAMFRVAGYLYIAFMEEYGVDREMAAWPHSIASAVGGLVGLVVAPLKSRLSITHIMTVASALSWIGIIASGFANNIVTMSVTAGVVHGIGSGTVYLLLQVFTMMYFDKFRGTALGIMSMGSALSGTVFTKLIEHLRNEYNLRYSLILLGALSMNISPLTHLLKVPPWGKPPKKKLGGATKRTVSTVYVTELGVENKSLPVDSVNGASNVGCIPDLKFLARCPMFYLMLISSAVTIFADYIFLSTYMDFALDKGTSVANAVWLTTCISVADMVGRICLPVIADRRYVRRSTLLVLNKFLMGIDLILAPHVTSYWMIAVLCSLTTAHIGCGFILHDVLVAEYLGLERLSVVQGTIGLVKTPLVLCIPALIGMFRDEAGSYDNMYRLLGGLLIFICVFWIPVVWYETRNQPKQEQPGNNNNFVT